jgi:selenide,water dikinase
VFLLGREGDPDAEAVVATVDFFTPVVESPFDFGRVAAANALSDVWAMGGEPLFALNLVGFPTKKLPMEVLEEILRGGAETAREAGIPILGGHSADFDVPVYGMSVTGRVPRSRIRRNQGARAGDALVLTKAIGTGILTSALRARALAGLFSRPPEVSAEEEAAALASMVRLNRASARAADAFEVHACTDVTGYGLLGHLREMLGTAGLEAEVWGERVPALPGARRLAAAGVAPDGSRRNLAGLASVLVDEAAVPADLLLLLADAQTSGGLLLAVPEREVEGLVGALHEAGDLPAAWIGRVNAGETGRLRLTRP